MICVRILMIFALLLQGIFSLAQISVSSDVPVIDYDNPKEYEIGGITVSGIKYLDHSVLIQLSGLSVGDIIMIPDVETTDAIKKLWKQGLFSDIKITATKVIGNKIFLDIYLQEQPRLSRFSFSGMKKSEVDDIREKLKLVKGMQVTENLISTIDQKIKNYFIDKGYLDTEVEIIQEDDTSLVNNVILNINVNTNEKIKINSIAFEGNTSTPVYKKQQTEEGVGRWNLIFRKSPFDERKLRRSMKETKQKTWYNIFKSSKFIESNYTEDKKNILARYNERGYRDAKIVSDTVFQHDEKTINIIIRLDEGEKYYIRNISWIGNTKYPSKFLNDILGLKRGDVYNQSQLEEKVFMSPTGVFSLYQDDGYLFSSVTPVEVLVENDSIDIEMRIFEGKQARINRVAIVGNSKTNDHVILREIRTKPGQLYSRSDIQRTIRELAQLGYFDPEKLNVDFNPDPANGTVDLEYTVEEKPSDQFELSGGWGARMFVGSIGLIFTNFSARNMLKPSAWRPIPTGDGQRLSFRAQSNGIWYQGYNMSFVEPWLGGKKPNSLYVSLNHTIFSNGKKKYITTDGVKTPNPDRQLMRVSGASVGLGRRLKWPDDFFALNNELSYQHYYLDNYDYMNLFTFTEGESNNFSFQTTIARNSSGPNPIYPVGGSDLSFSFELTPPYSMFREDRFWELGDEEKAELYNEYGTTAGAVEIQNREDKIKYKWIEYHKYSFRAASYTSLVKFGKFDLVLHTKAEFGYVGFYNKDLGPSPFEGYYMGGDGLMTYTVYGKETIPLRGYDNGSITSNIINDSGKSNGNAYDKFTFELRFPLSLNPSATLYMLTFAEAGNAWYNFSDVDVFDIKRSAGVGVRIFLPMFGKLGVDWGYGFDPVVPGGQRSGSQFHFIIGQNF
ncbi:MAG: outer membrane protein assembly factor BamA [Bacteroidetes bacterium]|nr:outer membrane protein assembly factor BamA [Bacteroidota bacterium]